MESEGKPHRKHGTICRSTGSFQIKAGDNVKSSDTEENIGVYIEAVSGDIVLNADGSSYITSVSAGNEIATHSYVDNAILANILAAESNTNLCGDVFNVGAGHRISVNEIHALIGNKEPEYNAPRAGDVKQSQADISKAKNILGYNPYIDFYHGLELTKEWYFKK
jgi:nucleoside-diphosphate-sugar epimerase